MFCPNLQVELCWQTDSELAAQSIKKTLHDIALHLRGISFDADQIFKVTRQKQSLDFQF